MMLEIVQMFSLHLDQSSHEGLGMSNTQLAVVIMLDYIIVYNISFNDKYLLVNKQVFTTKKM